MSIWGPWEAVGETAASGEDFDGSVVTYADGVSNKYPEPTRTIYAVQHWEDGDGIRSGWVTGYGYYTSVRADAETTLHYERRQYPDVQFRLAEAQITDWREVSDE